MSRHVTYRGETLDMDSIRRANEQVPAIGNMKVNARGDQIDRGVVTKTADELARENHRIQSAVVSTSIKGPQQNASAISMDPPTAPAPVKAQAKKVVKEKELPNGDIVEDTDA